jgi:YHS domain-containing protein
MTVNPTTTQFKAVVGGQTYYFCSASCQQKFTAAPTKFSPDSHRM